MQHRLANTILFGLSLILLVNQLHQVSGSCVPSSPASATSDVIPTNPTISSLADGAALNTAISTAKSQNNWIQLGCSEKVTIYTQTTPYTGPDSSVASSSSQLPDTSTWPRTSCPHLRTDLTEFSTAFPNVVSGQDIVIPGTGKYLLRSCSLPDASRTDPTFVLGRITIQSGGLLVIDDSPLILRVREILVQSGASLLAGSATCRLYSTISITFHGTRADSYQPTSAPATSSLTSKGIMSSGTLDIHGKLYFPTWTRLSRTAQVSDSIIYLQESVNWEVGQQILIVTSVLLDCKTSYATTYCKPCDRNDFYCQRTPVTHQNEVRTIRALFQAPNLPSTSTTRFTGIVLDTPLLYRHYGGVEYQAEVSLLSRRINLAGSATTEDFGGHVMIQGSLASGRISGVRGDNMGQKNELGRYPFHFHLLGDTSGSATSYFQDCSVTASNFRCYVIHGTNSTRLSRNTAYDVIGMCYYLEDGVEERNLLEYNQVALVNPVTKFADGDPGQGGDYAISTSSLLQPADISASGFYSLNAYNSWIGNIASGGWSGFAFPMTYTPTGEYRYTVTQTSPWAPYKRPLKRFIGNHAHSNGYHWYEHGSAIYVGAWLTYVNGGDVQSYSSGRYDRPTQNPDGTSSSWLIEHTKVYLCNKGISHWGAYATIHTAEMYDTRAAAMTFGSSSLINVLTVGSTPNLQDKYVIGRSKFGFQFYDRGVQTILSGWTFRNYTGTDTCFTYLDFGDTNPQGINSVRGLKFELTPPENKLDLDWCGPDCGSTRSTMVNRIYNVWDWDGSYSGIGTPQIVGSHTSWWNNMPEQNCVFITAMKVWSCDWLTGTTVAFMTVALPGFLQSCDSTIDASCSYLETAPYLTARMTQWGAVGASRSLDIGPWSGVAGFSNTGWYWRAVSTAVPAQYSYDGAPSQFTINEMVNLPRSRFVVLAVAYPAGAQFTVNLINIWAGNIAVSIPQSSSLATVLQSTENLGPASSFTCNGPNYYDMCSVYPGGVGPAWRFEGGFLYIRVVAPYCYNANDRALCEDHALNNFISDGIEVPNQFGAFSYSISATCPNCQVQSTQRGITFWTAPDAPPTARFSTSFGAIRTKPAAHATDSTTTPVCTTPITTPPSSTGTSSSSSTGASSTAASSTRTSSTGVSSTAISSTSTSSTVTSSSTSTPTSSTGSTLSSSSTSTSTASSTGESTATPSTSESSTSTSTSSTATDSSTSLNGSTGTDDSTGVISDANSRTTITSVHFLTLACTIISLFCLF